MSLCLAAGAVSAVLAANAFTLSWTHSIEKVRWEEDWRAVDGKLSIIAARIRGTGAGMEPPADAVLKNGIWHYRPALPPQEVLRLTHSPHTAGYELCVEGHCRPLADHLPEVDNTAVIELRGCLP
jgi:hypothetical protein